jgi:RNase P/RNase MRP subunit p29
MPAVGVATELRDQQGNAHRSEVLQCHRDQPGTLVLSPPADLPAEQAFKAGTRLLVSWPEDGSFWVLPVLLVELRPDGDSRLLVAEVDDDAWREERREFVRSALDATVLIDFEVEDVDGVAGPRGVGAELIDLSEVALRCVIKLEHREWIQPHIPVTVRIRLAGDQFEIAGEILLAKPAARLDLGLEVVILFERPVARVGDLRAHLVDRAAR